MARIMFLVWNMPTLSEPTNVIPFTSGKAKKIHDSDYVFGLEHANRALLRKGDWKITNLQRPFLVENFKLYNISNDLAELYDLKETEKEKYEELLKEWEDFSNEIKVQIPIPSQN